MPPLCIPHATGVPALPGPPNWLDAPPAGRPEIDDPRWVGSYSQGFGFGTAEEATFRALNHTTGGQTSLYLSWHVKFENTPSPDQDTLYVGFTRTAHPPLILKVVPYGAPGNTTLDAVAAADIVAGSRISAAGPTQGQLDAFPNVPNWVTDNLRIWHSPGDMDWAVHLRVPIKAGASLQDPDGIDLPATFKMWYCYDIYTPTRADSVSTDQITGGVLRLLWPSNALLTYTDDFVYPDPNSGTAPWLEYNLGNSSSPCSTGVGISLIGYTSIGTNTPDVNDGQIKTSTMLPQPSNTFYAQPTNNSGSAIPVGALKATFSLANWGSVANRNVAPWTVIGEASNTAIINNGTTAPINVVNLAWAPPQAWVNAMSLPDTDSDYKDDHQCMLVELSGVGLTFAINSIYRNMNFVPNSTYSRKAEISVVGLTPISILNRDVYLAVEALNLPSKVGDPGVARPRALAAEASNAVAALNRVMVDDQDRDRIQLIKDFVANYYVNGLDKEYNMPIEDLLDANLPTYRVHMYYDTGRRQTKDGKTHVILGLGSSFGLYGITSAGAQVEGWEHRLEGAIRIAENYYLLRVPNNGRGHVTTTLQSRAPGEQPLPEVPIQRWQEPTPLLGEKSPLEGCLRMIIAFFRSLFGQKP